MFPRFNGFTELPFSLLALVLLTSISAVAGNLFFKSINLSRA